MQVGLSTPLEAEEQERVRRLVWRGFLVRLVLAIVLEFSGFSSRLAPDEKTYAQVGTGISRYWTGDNLIAPAVLDRPLPKGYFYLNAISYTLFGSFDLVLKTLNAFLGAAACGLVYGLGRRLYGKDVAWRAANLYVFFPSLILWSALNIRDVWVVFLLLWISLKSLEVVQGYSFGSLVGLIAGLFAVSLFRDYLVVVAAIPPIAALLVGRGGSLGRNLLFAVIASLGLVVLVHQIGSDRVEHYMSLETMSRLRDGLASGKSAFQENVDISTPANALAFLPIGVAYFLFSPFPWEMTSVLKLISLPEMLFLYYLTPAIGRGFARAVRTRLRDSLQILLLTLLLTVSYALGEGNVGTLYRHRAQVMGFFLIFAALGGGGRVQNPRRAAG